jgi:Spy/CpxP family protein refolding chaperone
MDRFPVTGAMRALRACLVAALPAVAAAAPPTGESPEGTGQVHCPMHRGMDGTAPGEPGGMLRALDELGLDAAQRAALQALAERYRGRGVEMRQRGVALADDLKRVEPDDPDYAGATERAADGAAVLAADAVRLAAELRAEVHAILTDEQRQALRARSAAERKGWDEWRDRHRPAE